MAGVVISRAFKIKDAEGNIFLVEENGEEERFALNSLCLVRKHDNDLDLLASEKYLSGAELYLMLSDADKIEVLPGVDFHSSIKIYKGIYRFYVDVKINKDY